MSSQDKKLAGIILNTSRQRPRGHCPDEERLAAYVEGRLSEEQTDQLLSHISRCPGCLEATLALRSIMSRKDQEAEVRVPLSALTRARRLDPARQGLMEVVVSFVKGAAKVLKLSDDVVSPSAPAMEPVRGQGQVLSETLVSLQKQFPPYFLEIDIERTKPDRGEISLKLSEQDSGAAPTGVRVSLFNDNNELESAVLEEGSAVFENIRFGEYRLEITKAGEPIGRVALEMKGEQ